MLLIGCGNDTHLCNYIKPWIDVANYLYNTSYLIHFILRKIDLFIAFYASDHSYVKRMRLCFKKNVLGMYYFRQLIYPFPGLEETSYKEDGNPPVDPGEVPVRYHYMVEMDHYRVHLDSISRLLRRRGVTFISAGFLDNEMLTVNRELGVEDILNFEIPYSKQFYLVMNGRMEGHLNCEGHRLVAEELYHFLKDKNLLNLALK